MVRSRKKVSRARVESTLHREGSASRDSISSVKEDSNKAMRTAWGSVSWNTRNRWVRFTETGNMTIYLVERKSETSASWSIRNMVRKVGYIK